MRNVAQGTDSCRLTHPREQCRDEGNRDDGVRQHEHEECALVGRQPLRNITGLFSDEVGLSGQARDNQEANLVDEH